MKIFKRIGDLFVDVWALFLSLFIKRNEDYVAFGSWLGELYIASTFMLTC